VYTATTLSFGSRDDVVRWVVSVPPLYTAMLATSMLGLGLTPVGLTVVLRNVAPIVTLPLGGLSAIPSQHGHIPSPHAAIRASISPPPHARVPWLEMACNTRLASTPLSSAQSGSCRSPLLLMGGRGSLCW
jgi:hypothetical protein